MRTDAIVEDEILSKSHAKKPNIMYNIKILGYELILDSSVITFYETSASTPPSQQVPALPS